MLFWAENQLLNVVLSVITASSLESSKYIFPIGHDIQNISFVSGERSETTVSVPLTPLGKYALSQNFDGRSFLLKVFYNGEYIYKRQRKSHSNDVRHPSLLYFNYVLIRKEREISVTLELPTPVREDEGIYELQIFFSTFEIMQRLRTLNCSDYGNFLYSYEGLKLDYVLVGSTTLQFQNYGKELICCLVGRVISLFQLTTSTRSECLSYSAHTQSYSECRTIAKTYLFCGGEQFPCESAKVD